MSTTENLQKGITSLEYRIAALAAKLVNAKSNGPGESPRDISRQINEYGRTLTILQKQLDKVQMEKWTETDNKLSQAEDLLDRAWGIICNVGQGNWEDETPDWKMATLQFRDVYFELFLGLK